MDIYKDVKKGHKTAITKAVNNLCREHVFSSGWDITHEDIEKIVAEASKDYFVRLVYNSYATKEEKEAFIEDIRKKAINGFEEFEAKEPTPKQIYYYVNLCFEVGEKPKTIMSNKAIFLEISRLKLKLKSIEIDEKTAQDEIIEELY